MEERVDFWTGMATGTLVGMVVAAYTQGYFKRLLGFDCAESLPVEPLSFEPKAGFRDQSEGLNLRREASESASDPTRLSPAMSQTRETLQPMSMERPGGAPGGAAAHEILEVPGHPGHPLDHSDSAQRVRSASRTHDFTSS